MDKGTKDGQYVAGNRAIGIPEETMKGKRGVLKGYLWLHLQDGAHICESVLLIARGGHPLRPQRCSTVNAQLLQPEMPITVFLTVFMYIF
jgi:hypothetical protein